MSDVTCNKATYKRHYLQQCDAVNSLEVHWRFEGKYCLHPRGRKVSKASNHQNANSPVNVHRRFLLVDRLTLEPHDACSSSQSWGTSTGLRGVILRKRVYSLQSPLSGHNSNKVIPRISDESLELYRKQLYRCESEESSSYSLNNKS